MSVNKLNLQIGGGDPDEYARRKVEREISKQDVEIDKLMEDLFYEEMVAPALEGKAPPAVRQTIQEEVVYREPKSNVDILANYITKTIKEEPKEHSYRSLRETMSLEDRLALLEQDVFTKMSQAAPNTLVSGIGASLDSGGGAVWLWDLNDVEIGAPLNGVYPAIANGSLLKYNSTLTRWEAGPADDQTVEVNTSQVDLTNPQGDPDLINQADDIPGYSAMGTLLTQLDWNKKTYDFFTESLPLKGGIICADASVNTGNTSGILTIQATDTSDGRIVLNNSSGQEKITLNGHLGQGIFTASCNAAAFTATSATATSILTKTNFTGLSNFQEDVQVSGGKELTLNRGTANSTIGGLVIKGISAASAAQGTPTVSEILNTTYGSATTSSSGSPDTVTYTGGTDSNFSLQNKSSVQALINAGGGGVGFSFQGNCNVTISKTSGSQPTTIEEEEGYFYINTTAGVANATWVGIAGSTISANQLIIWSEANSRWFAGAVEDDTSFLKIDGTNYMEAKLRIDVPTPSGSSNAGFSVRPEGGNETFIIYSGGSAVMDGTLTVGSNVIPDTTNTGNLGSSTKRFSQVNAEIGNFDHITTSNSSTMANITPVGNGTNFLGGSSFRWNAYINDLHCSNVAFNLTPKSGENIDLGSSSRAFNNLYVNKITAYGTSFSQFEAGLQSKKTLFAYNAGGSGTSVVIQIKDPNNQNIGTGVGWFSSGNIQAGTYNQTASTTGTNQFYKTRTRNGFIASDNSGTNKIFEVLSETPQIKFGYDTATGGGATTSKGSSANYYFNGGKFLTMVIGRGSDNGNSTSPQIVIKGKTVGQGEDKNQNLLEVWRTTGSASDVIRYYGNTTSNDNNIQTKASVETLMAGTWTDIPGGTFDSDWTTKTKKYRVSNSGNLIDVYFQLVCAGGTTTMDRDIFIGTIPSSYRPTTDVAATAVAYSTSTTAIPSYFSPLLVTVRGGGTGGQVYVWTPGGTTLSGVACLRARFSYPMGG